MLDDNIIIIFLMVVCLILSMQLARCRSGK